VEFFLELVTGLESQIFVEDPAPAHERLKAEHGNIRAAIEWSMDSDQPRLGLRISAVAWRFWQQRGHLAEGRLLLERLLAAPRASSDPVSFAQGLTAYGGIAYWQGDHATARSSYEKALGLQLSAGDEASIAMAEYNLGWMLAFARDTAAALELLERSAGRYRALGDERGGLIAAEGLALTTMLAGDLARARDIAASVVANARRLGMRFHQADSLSLLAAVHLALGDAANARRALVESIAVFKGIVDLSTRPHLLEVAAGLAVTEERPADAARLLGAIAGLHERGERFFLPSQVGSLSDPEPSARAQLSHDEFEVAFEEGKRWPVETALEHATGPKEAVDREGE
jgi:tetratricopeptide (TPR) repeat protein